MATFGLAPMLGAFPPPASEDFPNFIQFRASGVDLGGRDADTVDFIGGLVTRGTGDNSGVVTVVLGGMAWREIDNDTVLVRADAEGGIASTGTTGMQSVTVPADTGDAAVDIPDGSFVLLYQEGAARLEVHTESGVTLSFGSIFNAACAEQHAVVTLIKRRANAWVLCGDMEIA